MKHNDTYYRNPKDKARAFNDYFYSSFTYTNPDELLLPNVNLDSSASPPLDTITVTVEEIVAFLHHLDPKKAHGPDGIPADELAPSLSSIFNLTLQSDHLPSQWKLAHVVPVHKKENKKISRFPTAVQYRCCVSLARYSNVASSRA